MVVYYRLSIMPNKHPNVKIQKARDEASRIVAKINSQAMSLIDELDELRRKKDKENFSQQVISTKSKAKGILSKMYLDANPVSDTDSSYKLPRPLKKGDTVYFRNHYYNLSKGIVLKNNPELSVIEIQEIDYSQRIHILKYHHFRFY